MSLNIIHSDITTMNVDAIVNAANTNLKMGSGVCGAIFKAAGASNLQAVCDNLAPIKTGEAVLTQGFKLPAKYIIHTAGPKGDYSGNGGREVKNLCVEFKEKMEKKNTEIFSHSELIELLSDAQTIYRVVLIYFDKNVEIDIQTFCPVVDSAEQNESSNEDALYEIRILDGDMFFLFDNM